MTAPNNAGLRKAAARAAELAAALAVPPVANYGDDYRPDSPRWRDQSLSKGAAGVSILHGVRAQHGHGGTEAMHAWLARATRDDLTAGAGAGLWFGAPAIAFAIHTAAPGRYRHAAVSLRTAVAGLVETRLKSATARMDAARRPSQYEFDLTRGLAGLGAHLLRHDPGSDLLRRVLTYLVRLTRPVRADDAAGTNAPGWWTSDIPSGPRETAFAEGHANFGMAHGVAGPLALLALAKREGVTVDGHHEAIEVICHHLDTWRQQTPTGPWWPERITLKELENERSRQEGPLRPSWCYGTPGLARAQQLAALALGDTTRQHQAEEALAHCLADPAQLARITDPALCHGWAGLLATAWHAATEASNPRIDHHLDHVLARLLDATHDILPSESPGLIEGSAGVALTLHSIATGTSDGWAACLLID